MPSIKTIKVTATGPEGWVVKTQSGEHTAIVDQPEGLGGTNTGPSPLDYVFVALAGCLITIAKIVAGQRKIDLRGVEVEVTGDVNIAVLRGQENDDRAGFKNIQATMKIDADLTKEEKEGFAEEVDRRCPVSENLMNATPVKIKVVE